MTKEPINQFTGDHRFLSNFYPVQIRMDGMIYLSVEHAYQASKTLDRLERWAIKEAPTPKHAKRLGKRVTLRPDWDSIKVVTMYELVRQKFLDPFHVELRYSLEETEDRMLVEGNTWGDTFWGICNGIGRNTLGHILVRVRTEMRMVYPDITWIVHGKKDS